MPVLLIATYRDDELTRRHPLYGLLPLLVRESQAERISLRALRDEDMHAWVAARFALDHADEERLVEYVGRYSDGNPLFIGELLRTLEDDQIIRQDGGRARVGSLASVTLPLLLRQILDRRLARTSSETRELLSIAAVIGQRISHDVWKQVAAVDDGALDRATREAIDGGLLADAGRQFELVFRHALIREVLYQDILPSRRQVWHRRVAEQLLATAAPDPDEVAHHLRRAGDPRAVEWLVKAGDRAYRGAYAFQTAARRYEAALENVGTRHDLLHARGWLLMRLAAVRRYADPGGSLLLLNDAVEIAARIGDEGLAAMAVSTRGTMRFLAGDNGLADVEAGAAALATLDDATRQRVGREVGSRVPDQIASKAGLVWWYGYHGWPTDALELAGQIAGTFPGTRRGELDQAVCEAGKAFAYSLLGRIQEARAAFSTARRLMEEHRYAFHVTTMTAFELYLLDLPYFTTDLAERSRKAEQLLSFAERGLQELVRIPPKVTTCGLLLIDGRWHEFSEMLDVARTAPRSFFIWNYAVPALATHARYTGQPARAWELLRLLLPQGPQTNVGETGAPLRGLEGLRLGAELALDAGELDEAEAWIAAHDRWLDWSGYVPGRAEGSLLHARYHRLRGDLEAAQANAESALELSADPRQPLALIASHRFLAELNVERQRLDAPGSHLEIALELSDACAAPYERALTLLVWARLDLSAGESASAIFKLDEVIAISSRLGAGPLQDEAARLLDEAMSPSSAGLLSARELDVLALVAEGLTDREVAGQLYISPRTVNQHLRSIYNKLGVNSRAAATRRAIELDLLSKAG